MTPLLRAGVVSAEADGAVAMMLQLTPFCDDRLSNEEVVLEENMVVNKYYYYVLLSVVLFCYYDGVVVFTGS